MNEQMRYWWEPATWTDHPLPVPKFIYFDMDDTLTRTTDWFVEQTRLHLIRNEMTDLLTEFERIHGSGGTRFDYPPELTKVNSLLVRNCEYMNQVKPTPLFNYFFLIPGNQPTGSKFGIVTQRGDNKKAEKCTANWFKQFEMAATLSSIHCIHPKKMPSKIDYLMTIHPDGNFILVDDNPLYDVSIVHPHHRQLRIHTQHSTYGNAYSNQRVVEYRNGLYIL